LEPILDVVAFENCAVCPKTSPAEITEDAVASPVELVSSASQFVSLNLAIFETE